MRPEITSEYGDLETVLVHTPGGEHLRMIPWEGGHPLFTSKTPSVDALRADHGDLRRFLEAAVPGHGDGTLGASENDPADPDDGVFEVTQLLAEIFEASDLPKRRRIVGEIVGDGAARAYEAALGSANLLEDRPAAEVVADLVEGYPRRWVPDSDGRLPPLVLTPMRSLMWMRDAAFATPSGAVIGSMSAGHRQGEPSLVGAVLRHHPRFGDDAILLDLQETAQQARDAAPTGLVEPAFLEGGNVLVLDDSTLAVGVGTASFHYARKTTRSGFLQLARALFEATPQRVERLYLVHMPDLAGFIHLDTLLNLMAPRTAVAMPYVLGGGGSEGAEVLVNYVRWLRDALVHRAADLRRIPTPGRLAMAGRCEIFERDGRDADGTPRPRPESPRPILDQLIDDGYLDPGRIAWVGGDPEDHPSPYEHLHTALYEQRNQAANVFTASPGRAIAYGRNPATLVSLDRLATRTGLRLDRMGSNEMRTGGGGPHCLTLPLRRRPVDSGESE